jgi:uncharacterized protein YegJ (DUF2314 family)
MMRQILAIAAALGVLAAGCGKTQPEDRYTHVSPDDARMNAAIEQARSSVDIFIAAIQSPKPGQSAFSVKTPVSDGQHIEHFWLMPVTYDGTKFEGVIANEPFDVTNVKLGQRMTVERSQISDWMFVENGKLVGGYTLRILRSTLPPEERAEFDKSLPYVID